MSDAKPPKAALVKVLESKIRSMTRSDMLDAVVKLNVSVPGFDLSQRRPQLRIRRPSAATPAAKTAQRISRPADPQPLPDGAGIGPLISRDEGNRLLDRVTVDSSSVDWIRSDVSGSSKLAAQLGVSPPTLDNWRKAGKVIALRKGLRNFVFPTRQIVFERSAPVAGLDVVSSFFATPENAWAWLVVPNRMTDGLPPIDLLLAGKTSEVQRAAEGAVDYARA